MGPLHWFIPLVINHLCVPGRDRRGDPEFLSQKLSFLGRQTKKKLLECRGEGRVDEGGERYGGNCILEGRRVVEMRTVSLEGSFTGAGDGGDGPRACDEMGKSLS